MRPFFLLVLALSSGSAPCNIPVFRYALERWPAEPYRAYVVHREPLSKADRDVLGRVRSDLNLEIQAVELGDDIPLALRRAMAKTPPAAMPWMIVLFPGDEEAVAWEGPLEASVLDRLAESPARRELVKRLLSGTSAVWLLFESGDRARDDAAAALVEAELRRLETALQIPAPGPDDPPLRLALPLKVAFSLLRIAHDDAAERDFAGSVLRGRGGEVARPAVVPVFGRARALHVLDAEEIRPGDLTELAEYISGACSCEVKELNPGVDLLVAADWDLLLELGPEVEDPERPRVGPGPVALPPAPRDEPPVPAPSSPSVGWPWLGLAAAAIAAALTGWALFRGRAS